MGLLDIVPAGVITGDNVRKVFNYASKHGFAIPAINCTSSSTINAALGKLSCLFNFLPYTTAAARYYSLKGSLIF